jgi:hypothetical protein
MLSRRLAAIICVEIFLVSVPWAVPDLPFGVAVVVWCIAAMLGLYALSGSLPKRWRPEADPWHQGRKRLTIREAGCLLADVPPQDFDSNAIAQSKASALRYYVNRGAIPIAGAPPADQSARKAAVHMGFPMPEATLDTYVTRADLDAFLSRRQL